MAAPDPMAARRAEADLEKRRADALLTACDLGLVDDVSDLITSGASTDVTDKRGSRPMFFAAARGHTAVVELLCSHGVDPNDDDALGRTPLHFAAMHDHPETVRALCARDGIWVDAPDHADDTPLLLAARMASPETVAALLDARADPDVKNKLGLTPLFEAAVARERFDVAEPIVRARPDAPKSQRVGGGAAGAPATTLPDAAATMGRDAAVAWLAARGAKVTPGASHATRAGSNPPSFAELDPETRASRVRAWARAKPNERDAAGVPDASRDALDAHAQLTQEVELRVFLMRLVDDDEFQEDMRDATIRRAVDEVVADFRAVERWRGNARAMRVLDAFRRVQRFCKERGRKIAFADVLVANEREAEAKRAELRRLRRGVELVLRRAEEAAAAAEEGTRDDIETSEEPETSETTSTSNSNLDVTAREGVWDVQVEERSAGAPWRRALARAATRAAVFAVSLFVTVYVFGFPNPLTTRGKAVEGEL